MQKLALLVLFLIPLIGLSQTDRVFWFAAPDISSTDNEDTPITLHITTYNLRTKIKIWQPANPAFPPFEITIDSNSKYEHNLSTFKSIIENSNSLSVTDFGLKIEADNDISVYYEVGSSSNKEFFVLKGDNGLGNEFYLPGQTKYSNKAKNVQPRQSYYIVATEDDTTVSIDLTNPTLANSSSGLKTFSSLKKGQVISISSSLINVGQRLVGSHVTSNKPVAITYSDDSLSSGASHDLVGDQIVPINTLGNEYVVFGSDDFGGHDVFITGVMDNTVVSYVVDGASTAMNEIIDAGETISINYNKDVSISTPGGELLYVFNVIQGDSAADLAGAIIPSIGCNGSRELRFLKIGSSDYILSLLTRKENISSFEFGNGTSLTPTGVTYRTAFGIEWAYLNINIGSYSNGTYLVRNTKGIFQASIASSDSFGTSYGYISNFGGLDLDEDVISCGDPVILDLGLGSNYKWEDADTGMFLSNNQSIYLEDNVNLKGTVEIDTGCVVSDFVSISFVPENFLGEDIEKYYCDDAITLELPLGHSDYKWEHVPESTSNSVMVDFKGVYTATANYMDTECPTEINFKVTQFKTVIDEPGLNCSGFEISVKAESTVELSNEYEWYLNSQLVSKTVTSVFMIKPKNGDTFSVKVTSDSIHCPATDSLEFDLIDSPSFDNSEFVQCDSDGDGLSLYNLNIMSERFLDAEKVQFTFEFYETMEDAENKTNRIPKEHEYYNKNPNQKIYIYSFNKRFDECSNISIATLKTSISGVILGNEELGVCDDDSDGESEVFHSDMLEFINPQLGEIGQSLDNSNLLVFTEYENALLDKFGILGDGLIPFVFSEDTKMYAKILDDNFGCNSIIEFSLSTRKTREYNIENNVFICPNGVGTIGIDLLVEDGNSNYLWSTEEEESHIKVNATGTYNIWVSSDTYCDISDSVQVRESMEAEISEVISDGNRIEVVLLDNFDLKDYMFALNDNEFQESNVFENVDPGDYIVTISDISRCKEISVKTSVIGFPQFFTPNSDGQNDFWQIIGQSGHKVSNAYIFNKLGALIHSIDLNGLGWDGTYNSELAEKDDYWYVVQMENGSVHKGHFSLKY